MSGLERALLRFLGVWTVLTGVELLERVAYRAGVGDAATEAAATFAELADAVEDLAAADCSDVVAAHADCCGVPA